MGGGGCAAAALRFAKRGGPRTRRGDSRGPACPSERVAQPSAWGAAERLPPAAQGLCDALWGEETTRGAWAPAARTAEPGARGQAAAWRALRASRARGKESRSRVDAPERPCAALAPAVTASGVTRLSLSLWGWGRVHSPKKSSGQACRGPGGRFSGDSEGLDRDRQRVCSP